MILFLIKVIIIMSSKLPCPKCNSMSWIDVEDTFPVQKCVCGYRKYLQVENDGMVISHIPSNVGKVVMPTQGTQLSKILGCLVVMGDMTSSAIAERLKVSTDNATTNLSVLRSRGLVRIVTNRKGYIGGSLWTVDEHVKEKYLGG